jgi:hypothetical protein
MKTGALWIAALAVVAYCFQGRVFAGPRSASDTSGGISGIVTDMATGQPVAGATIYLNAKTNSDFPFQKMKMSGADGSYSFTGLAPITEAGLGYLIHSKTPRYLYAGSDLVHVQPGEIKRLDIRLRKSLTVVVEVREKGGTMAPLSAAKVAIITAGDRYPSNNGIADLQGRVIFKESTPGVVQWTVALDGFRTRVIKDTLTGIEWDDTLRVEMEKEGGAGPKTLKGTFKTVSGIGMEGTKIYFTCHALEGLAAFWQITEKDGVFLFPGIPVECATGVLWYRSSTDSSTVSLGGSVTVKDIVIQDDRTLGIRRNPETHGLIPSGSGWPSVQGLINILGRRFNR